MTDYSITGPFDRTDEDGDAVLLFQVTDGDWKCEVFADPETLRIKEVLENAGSSWIVTEVESLPDSVRFEIAKRLFAIWMKRPIDYGFPDGYWLGEF